MTNHYLDRSIPEPTIEEKIQKLRDKNEDLAKELMNTDVEKRMILDIIDKIDELGRFSSTVGGIYLECGMNGGIKEEEFVKNLLFANRLLDKKDKRIQNRRDEIMKKLNNLLKEKEENGNGYITDNK